MADGDVKLWSGKDDWNTPPEIWDRVRLTFCGDPTLDPFWNPHSLVTCGVHTLSQGFEDWCGLTDARRTAFVNPPFSKAGKAVRHCASMWMHGWEIVMLVPSSVSSTHHHEIIAEAPALCEPSKRVTFWRCGKPEDSPRNDVVLAYLGGDPWRFRRAFRDYGRVRFG